jgi:glycine reductase complex component B subunit gamma
MANELERNGMPAVLITNLVSVAAHMKVNRFVSGVSIPHLLGDPNATRAEEKKLRWSIVEKALTLLAT